MICLVGNLYEFWNPFWENLGYADSDCRGLVVYMSTSGVAQAVLVMPEAMTDRRQWLAHVVGRTLSQVDCNEDHCS